ncbi:MAG: hypothetical protein WC762_03125 [Methylobacter sp.]|jgi:hypothetical protein
MSEVRLRKTIIQTVQASKVISITATLEDGSTIQVTGPITVGDYNIIDQNGEPSILSAADYAAELVSG